MTTEKNGTDAQGANLLNQPKAETPQTPPQALPQGEGETKPPPAQVAMATAAKKTAMDFRTAKTSQFISFFSQMEAAISQQMPDNMKERAVRQLGIAAQIISKDDKLKACDPATIMGAVMFAATSGLDLSLKHGYLVAYNNKKTGVPEMQYQMGYRGAQFLAMNTGVISGIVARPVFVGDAFDYEYGYNEFIKHRPAKHTTRPEFDCVYAIATMKDGSKVSVVLGKWKIEELRQKNKQQYAEPSNIWATDYAEMACAKAIKYLCEHYLPLSVEQIEAFEKESASVVVSEDGKFEIVE